MQTETLKLRPVFLRSFGKKQLLRQVESLLAAHPRIYLTLLTPLALLGYLLLIFFPLSSVVLIGQLASSWSLQSSLSMPQEPLIQLLAGLAALGFSLPLFRLRFDIGKGYLLESNDIPDLHKTITELCQTYHLNNIDKILLDESMDIRVINDSKLASPINAKYSLIIGLPVLLSYSPSQFHAILARRIGQAGGRDQFFLLWLNHLNETWRDYAKALAQGSLLALPLATLFCIYSRILQNSNQFAHQLYELAADRYALEVTNDQEMAELFSQIIITENFLQNKYWPKIKQLSRRSPSPNYPPYANMSKVIRNGLLAEDIQNALKKAWHYPDVRLQQPSLLTRLHNIGYEKPRAPRRMAKSAGAHYLSKTILRQLIDEFDQRWLTRMQQH